MKSNNSVKKINSITLAGVATVVAIVTSIASIGLSVYQIRHNDKNIDSGKTINLTYKKSSGTKTQTLDLKPSKGNVYYSILQSQGNNKMKYTIAYKKSTSSSYTNVASGISFKKNNVYTNEKKIVKANGRTKYNMKISKTSGVGTQSKISIDWLLK